MATSFQMRGIAPNDTPWAGGFERINAYAYFAWLIVLAVTVMRRERSVRRGRLAGVAAFGVDATSRPRGERLARNRVGIPDAFLSFSILQLIFGIVAIDMAAVALWARRAGWWPRGNDKRFLGSVTPVN